MVGLEMDVFFEGGIEGMDFIEKVVMMWEG